MRLVVTTPTEVIADASDVSHIRAEDETGAFGILPGHADFLTILPASVVSWRRTDGAERFVVVHGGVLTVNAGERVEIAARGAFCEDDLANLDTTMLEELQRSDETEEVSRTTATRLHLATIRQIQRVLQGRRNSQPGALSPQSPED